MDAKRWALAQIALYTALREHFADKPALLARIDATIAQLRGAA